MSPFNTLRHFLKLESASGIILFVMALLALGLENSPWANVYRAIQQFPVSLHIAEWHWEQPLLFWINEGFMTLFFLLVGLELKREFLIGELSEIKKIILPGVAALGGMLVPIAIYILINGSDSIALKGWAVPVATDIAFALGVLSLFGNRVPLGLKLFLMALAIFDDVGAIIIVTLFHAKELSYLALLGASAIIFSLWWLNRLNITRLWPYLLLGFLLWCCILCSGVHATVAGVVLAFFIPLREQSSPLQRLEEILHPWVAYFIMPLFAFANAGLSFQGMSWLSVTDHITVGVIVGLLVGKQLGVFGFALAMIKFGWANLPEDTSWLEFYGVALLCGIGFTMSLFLGTLAFEGNDPIYLLKVRLGVLLGSLFSGLLGAVILSLAFARKA